MFNARPRTEVFGRENVMLLIFRTGDVIMKWGPCMISNEFGAGETLWNTETQFRYKRLIMN